MRALAGLVFAAILTPLGLRLALPFVDIPRFARPIESLLIWWTDLLAVPFRFIDVSDLLGGGLGFRGIEAEIVGALIGWTIVQAVVLAVLGLFRRRPRHATDHGADDAA